jgi:hypothetical protein
MTRFSRTIITLTALLTVSATQAELLNRGNGLIYDDVLDITWMQDANYLFTTTPDECFIGPEGEICFPASETVGLMTFNEANTWAADLSFGGYDDWRLPTSSPIGGSTFNTNFTNNATSDEGYAKTTTNGSDGGWRDGSGNPVSEMGYMYYVNLANLGFYTPNDGSPAAFVEQPGWGLNNTEQFFNISKDFAPYNYWTGTVFDANKALYFNFASGFQGRGDRDGAPGEDSMYVWAVRDGDVAAVPVPAAVWLFGTALGLLGWMRRKAN